MRLSVACDDHALELAMKRNNSVCIALAWGGRGDLFCALEEYVCRPLGIAHKIKLYIWSLVTQSRASSPTKNIPNAQPWNAQRKSTARAGGFGLILTTQAPTPTQLKVALGVVIELRN